MSSLMIVKWATNIILSLGPMDIVAPSFQWQIWKVGLKGLYYKVCLMNHKIHTSQEWNILTFDLICNSKFDTLKLVSSWSTLKYVMKTW